MLRRIVLLSALLLIACVPLAAQVTPTVTVQILSPLDASSYASGAPVLFDYTVAVTDTTDVPVVTTLLNGQPGPVAGDTLSNLAAGTYVYDVSATAGGVAGSEQVTFTVTAPVTVDVLIASPVDGQTYVFGAPILFDYGVTVANTTEVPVVTTILNGLPGPIAGDTLSGLLPGTYVYDVSATAAGVTGAAQSTFDVANSVGKVTGGGWITAAPIVTAKPGKPGTRLPKCTFGLNAMCKPRVMIPRGSLSFEDHGLMLSVKSTGIAALGIANGTAVVAGSCTINGEAGHTFTLTLADGGKGRNKAADSFAIALDTGYQASGALKGGNITIHK